MCHLHSSHSGGSQIGQRGSSPHASAAEEAGIPLTAHAEELGSVLLELGGVILEHQERRELPRFPPCWHCARLPS